MLESEVETYDRYLTGEVYLVTTEKLVKYKSSDPDFPDTEEWEYLDSTGWYYGYEYAKEEAESILSSYKKENEDD